MKKKFVLLKILLLFGMLFGFNVYAQPSDFYQPDYVTKQFQKDNPLRIEIVDIVLRVSTQVVLTKQRITIRQGNKRIIDIADDETIIRHKETKSLFR